MRIVLFAVLAGFLAQAGEGSLNRAALLGALQEVMGPLPEARQRCPLAVSVVEHIDCGDYSRQLITYASEPGARVPAYLLLPRGAESERAASGRRFPAVLALHQTHPAGQKVVVGLGNSPDDEYGVELVKRGYVVLAPPYPLLADYAPDLRALGYASGTMKAIWENIRGLDLLAALPFVRTNQGFGCIGHSLGGHNGLFTAAFDERIAVVVTSCGFDSFRDYQDGNLDVWQPEKGWCQLRYMPRLAEYRGQLDRVPFDFPQVLAAIAPRRVFVSAPLGDTNFRWRSVDRVVEQARVLAARLGVVAQVEVAHPDGPHRFPPEQRERAYEMFDEVLRPRDP